jgi:hypothetical protein
MAMLFYLGGGQRRQIYANFLLGDVVWVDKKMVLFVPAEKVARLHTYHLPLPVQLYTTITFYIQHIRPHLFLFQQYEATNPKYGFWINSSGGAMEPGHFSHQLWVAFNLFNPLLNITPIDFRRMTVTALFASKCTHPI